MVKTNSFLVKPVDRATSEKSAKLRAKLRAESARAKEEKTAKQLSDLIEKVKINQLAAKKIKLNKVRADIGEDDYMIRAQSLGY